MSHIENSGFDDEGDVTQNGGGSKRMGPSQAWPIGSKPGSRGHRGLPLDLAGAQPPIRSLTNQRDRDSLVSLGMLEGQVPSISVRRDACVLIEHRWRYLTAPPSDQGSV